MWHCTGQAQHYDAPGCQASTGSTCTCMHRSWSGVWWTSFSPKMLLKQLFSTSMCPLLVCMIYEDVHRQYILSTITSKDHPAGSKNTALSRPCLLESAEVGRRCSNKTSSRLETLKLTFDDLSRSAGDLLEPCGFRIVRTFPDLERLL